MINLSKIPTNSHIFVPKGAVGWILSEIGQKKLLYIACNDWEANHLAAQLQYIDDSIQTITIPAWDNIPYDSASPHIEVSAKRIEALYNLLNLTDKGRSIIIVPDKLLLNKLLPPERIIDGVLTLQAGHNFRRDDLVNHLIKIGFNRQGTAIEPGDFALRGSIVDIVTVDGGYRLDFFGNKLESIRIFDPSTQLSHDQREEMTILPISEVILDQDSIAEFSARYKRLFGLAATDTSLYQAIISGKRYVGLENWLPVFYPQLSSLADYLPKDITIVANHNLSGRLEEFATLIQNHYNMRIANLPLERSYYPVPPESLWLSEGEVEELFRPAIILSEFQTPQTLSSDIEFLPIESGISPIIAMKKILQNYPARQVMITCYSEGSRDRLQNILASHDLLSKKIEKYEEIKDLAPPVIALAILEIASGFIKPDLIVITEEEVVGERISNFKRRRRDAGKILTESVSFVPGELVVHKEHGIGRFESLANIAVAETNHDCLLITYAGGDKLYIPVENIEVISKYGPDDGVKIDKLGSVAWQSRKAKLRNRIKLAAEYLLKIAAQRELREAPIFTPIRTIFDEFCSHFPYVETEDQLAATEEILEDLSSGRPMDRLICGDVGFGKTEVAMRAACAVAYAEGQEEKPQIAVIVPTTLLARQHYINFIKRFSGFSIKIRQLSRLVPSREARKTRQEIAQGEVDIVIGTHALLAKSLIFKNLALLIVDEEQHFGVAQKERLKEIAQHVHVLTLSATPIPRTLQMSLIGIRSLSLLSTPPVDRQAIKTFIMNFDNLVIREAILHEIGRGGRVFYICPYIRDLEKLYPELCQLVPEVKITMAHGQMNMAELDQIMNDFYDGKIDVLLSTSIIESGIDVQAANTIIIHNAHMFGLAQLYQMRGRVGRGKVKSFAYLITPKFPTQDALKRLEIMQKLDYLGAGFTLASHDMDIRGFGNLLGDEQSGHIKEVGIELYQDMLKEAIEAERGVIQASGERKLSPSINLGVSVLIPDSYVEDLSLRLSLYRRIASLTNQAEIDDFAAELIDRFGPLPSETENLLSIILLKQFCIKCNIEKLDVGAKGIVITFFENHFPAPEALIRYVVERNQHYKLRGDQKLVIHKTLPEEFTPRFQKIKTEIEKLLNLI